MESQAQMVISLNHLQGESEEEAAAAPIFSPTPSKKQQSPAAKGQGASHKRAGHAQDDTAGQGQSRVKGAEKGMIMTRRPDPRRRKAAKRTSASGDNGLNDPTHPLYAMMLKLVDNAQEKGFKNIDLQKDRWTEAKAKDLKPDEIYRVKNDWLADQIAARRWWIFGHI